MKTRRRFLLLAGSGSLALVVGGCKDSAKDSSPTVPTTPSPSAPPPPPPPPPPAPPPSAPGPTVLPKGARSYAQKIVYPAGAMIQNGGSVYDITNPPLASLAKAKGDGVADDTAAFVAAFDHVLKLMDNGRPYTDNAVIKLPAGRFIIYIPDGVYRVTDTITYSGPTRLEIPGVPRHENVVGIKFIGQSRDGTIIRLAPNAAGFGNVQAPKPVMQFIRPDVEFNNWAVDGHGCRNFTIDVTNNRGAVGIGYWSANNGLITNMLLRADDNAGFAGIYVPKAVFAGYVQDITIQGFDYGFLVIGDEVDSCPVLEYLSLIQQRLAGISVAKMSINLRNLAVSGGATAVDLTGPSAQVIVIDSDLKGGGSTNPAIRQVAKSHLHLRNVSAAGFAATVAEGTQTKLALGTALDYSSLGTKYTRAGQKALNLPIKEVPVPVYDPAPVNWVRPSGLDQASVQAAFSAGKPIVYFPSNRRYNFSEVNVPATTKIIDGMGGFFSGTLTITESSAEPLFLVDMIEVAINNKTNRTIVLYQSGNEIRNTVAGTEWYLCCVGQIDLSGFSAASVWGRWINSEAVRYLTIDNCTWVQLGYKSERQDSEYQLANGPGVIDPNRSPKPCIQITNSSKVDILGATFAARTTTNLLSLDRSSQACAVMNNCQDDYRLTTNVSVVDAGGRNIDKTEFPVRSKNKNGLDSQYFYDVRCMNL
jgi:hypothetical protein